MNTTLPPPPYTTRHFDRHASQLRPPAYRRSYMNRYHPYPRYGAPLIVDVTLPGPDPDLTIVAAAAMVYDKKAGETKPEGGGGWKWLLGLLIAFAILERVLEHATILRVHCLEPSLIL
ncbi:uncharacterized protein BT62DRAFT_998496 [Guyanagaster necrorhizus]|uniref:Uncharacterized protein n=1 Tax=Guyanagaster necrorhizus TaxID=856835 RepID=A0A9P7W5S5_9AGAR|nr:uncharacterized protein BT62DRAFT_998496 [Guyanagaster necrorhizus MCA 3950]KAG7452460.1 hypothetical protein BT62DRAFT_998496 [Guyanagaster necrorhizus MCA 3950]